MTAPSKNAIIKGMSNISDKTVLDTIGSTEYVDIEGYKSIPAKIDTGADSSSIWASHIEVNQDGILSFQLFDEKSPFYTGETLKRKDFKVAVIRSSSGHEQIRYRVHFSLTLSGRKIRALFNLSDRSKNNFPVLIGRRTISGKFLVDVTKKNVAVRPKKPKTQLAQSHLEKDPYLFHQKYLKNNSITSSKQKGAK